MSHRSSPAGIAASRAVKRPRVGAAPRAAIPTARQAPQQAAQRADPPRRACLGVADQGLECTTKDGTLWLRRPFQPCMDSLWQDVRLGFRTLVKAPLFTTAVVLTLGLGIGANAAVFTIVNRLLLKPLPVRDPGSLYVLAVQHEGNEEPHNVSWLDYQDFKDKSGAFEDLAAYDVNFVGLSTEQSRRAHHGQLRHQQLFLDARRAAGARARAPARRCGRAGRRSDRHPRAYLLEETLQCRSIAWSAAPSWSTARRTPSRAWCPSRSKGCTRSWSSTPTCRSRWRPPTPTRT